MKRRILVIALLSLTALLFSACRGEMHVLADDIVCTSDMPDAYPTEEEKTDSESHIFTCARWPTPRIDEESHISISATWPEFRLEDLMERSSVVVFGRVREKSAPFLIESSCGSRIEAIDFYIEPYEILRGDASLEQFVVREFMCTMFMAPNVELEIGDMFLLFLRGPSGNAFDTPGEYFYALRSLKTRGARILDDIAFEYSGSTLLLSELREKLAEVNARVPVPDELSWRQEELDNVRGNMERGVIEWDEALLEEIENRPFRPARIVED